MQRKIIVADEDAALVQRIQQTLETQGYVVRTAFTGEQVMSLVTDTIPDLLVLGHRLADGEGFAVLETLRSRPDIPPIPLIMLTAHIEPEEVFRGWRLGVDDYQSKRADALPNLTQEMVIKIKYIFRSIEEDRETQATPL